MASWLESYPPRRFSDLALDESTVETIERVALQANPPHLLISGPPGSGKTAAWHLIVRQVLGPAWRSTTHVLQAKDLMKTAGAMAAFESFLRPGGKDSSDTLASRTSLDAFDSTFSQVSPDDVAPAGHESQRGSLSEVHISRIIVIEDADYLGHKRQPLLRRMMEATSQTSRFIFTAQTPSRLIDALRSRTQHIRFTGVPRKQIESRLGEICTAKGIEPVRGILGDIAHISNGNLRKAIFTTEVLALRDLLGERANLHRILTMISTNEVQRMIEAALRGQVVEWRWEKDGYKNTKKLKGALGIYDSIISQQSLEAEDVVEQVHQVLTGGRLNLPEDQLTIALGALSDCDVRLRRSSQGRIQVEKMLHEFAAIQQQ